ncbi:MAG: acyl-CoA dehydrogenase family protein [Nocardioides sp.]|uniref:acyl-CoA dehydrogenase family protein n=1 Tax=Nocardioides sp. TaxID=35761 RepID=UPI0032656E2B
MSNAANIHRANDPHDFLNLQTLVDSEELAIQQSVRRFVEDRVLPEIGDWYDEGVFPRDLAKEMGSLGLLGMHLEGYGCAGTNAVSYGLACLELEAGDSGFRSFVSVQGSLAMFPIHAFGSEEQKQQWLPGMAAGELIGCFGLTEPDSGSDPGSMRTTARRDGTDWILNGTKMWITNGPIADVAIIWARAEEGIRGFVVPTTTPGFTANTVHKKASLRASVTGELVLEDVRLPETAVLPGVVGLRGPLSCLNEARFGILFGAVGAGRACYESALAYSISREQFGQSIAGFQLVQRKLVEMMISVNRSTLVALHLGRLKDAGTLTPAQVSFGKMDNVRQALDVAREARNSLGANGITLEYPVIRHMNNLESVYTYEGTNEIHTLALGHAITGIAAYR